MELASYHPSGAYNFEAPTRFSGNLCTPAFSIRSLAPLGSATGVSCSISFENVSFVPVMLKILHFITISLT